MKTNTKALLAAAGTAAFAFSPAHAYEHGFPGFEIPPGVLIGASAGVPPPGIYMANQVFTYQSNLVGPGTTNLLPGNAIGGNVGVQANVDVQAFLFVPGWTFLGATYDAVIAQPFISVSIGSSQSSLISTDLQSAGMHNTYFVPVELSWKLGGGFATKIGLGISAPDGTIQGPTGLNNVGNPWWTFHPEIIVSYLANGWNLSVAAHDDINTANSLDGYKTGDIVHVDFTATHTFGKWTVGPVAYWYGQVSDDTCTGSCISMTGGTGLVAQRFSVWAVGGLVEYNFGPASLQLWATKEISASASNSHPEVPGADFSLITQGATVFATLSYRLWAPEAPVAPAVYHK